MKCPEIQQSQVIAADHLVTQEKCVIKMVDKSNCNTNNLRTKIENWKILNHPNIVKLKDIFENEKYVCLIMERYIHFMFVFCFV